MSEIIFDLDNQYIRAIIKKAISLSLPINYNKNTVGLGGTNKFYMFWINKQNDILTFNSRIKYNISRGKNVVRIEINESNMDEIIKCIDSIYLDYQSYINNNPTQSIEAEAHINSDFDLLSVRARNILKKLNITTREELKNYDIELIENVENCGKKTIKEISGLMNLEQDSDVEKYEYIFKDLDTENIVVNRDVNEETINKYKTLGNELINIFYNWNKIQNRNIEIFKKYIFSDLSLQSIGEEYSISREWVRQIVDKYKRRAVRIYSHKPRIGCTSEEHIKINELFSNFSKEEYIDFLYYGLYDLKKRTKLFILSILLGEEKADILLSSFSVHYKEAKTEKTYLSKEEKRVKNLSILIEEKIIHSKNKCKYKFEDFKEDDSLDKYYSHSHIKQIIESLDNNCRIIINPNLYYDKIKNQLYNPSMMIELPNKELVLALFTDTIKLAVTYNQKRFKKFIEFCDLNGFGSIICDNRLFTYQDAKNIKINEDAKKEFINELENNKILVWRDIKEIKEKYNITTKELVSFILNSNYYFTTKPFMIRKI